MTLDELKRLDPNKIGSWPILPKLGVLLLLLPLVFASYWFDWQDQIAAIDSAKAKEFAAKAANFNSLPGINYAMIRTKAKKMAGEDKAG